ncbi:1-phosphofructokinase [Aeromicrobium flavum]|uniref:1-phosphofructokinase n=1 Tax=Aeromicrobium flavum TaxID=416568 RepID=A0A512HYS3_9ACTN|nr:1-phosphofructokinase family hexose kinase [Aeromicrobium flavum]GEO90574.1 1-phosphofructokinase [Aeromicrobium flavum]
MIVTVTANPATDRLVGLLERLERGAVVRAEAARDDPGGKGVNVARVLHAAGVPVTAVLPGAADEPLLAALDLRDVPYRAVPVRGRLRVNLTLAEPEGTTTKINSPGPRLDEAELAHLTEVLIETATPGDWAVLSGSLPPGVPFDWYASTTTRLQGAGVRVAVDASGAALSLAVEQSAPDLIKPNSDELAELLDCDPDEIERDHRQAAARAQQLRDSHGIGAVLLTLGGAGAVLATSEGSWSCPPVPITVRSTVGAGDSSLAGYLVAEAAGRAPAECLASAAAHGAAAAALSGSALPTPSDLPPLPTAVAVEPA